MAKEIRKIKEKINMADLIIEFRDSRMPFSSANPKDFVGVVENIPQLL